jgi:hypothetical protein
VVAGGGGGVKTTENKIHRPRWVQVLLPIGGSKSGSGKYDVIPDNRNTGSKSVFRIRIRMFLDLPDPAPDLSIIKQKSLEKP